MNVTRLVKQNSRKVGWWWKTKIRVGLWMDAVYQAKLDGAATSSLPVIIDYYSCYPIVIIIASIITSKLTGNESLIGPSHLPISHYFFPTRFHSLPPPLH